jgi:cytochrome c peroxidase
VNSRLSAAMWLIAVSSVLALGAPRPAGAQVVQNLAASLKTVPTPEPANLNQFLNADGQGRITDAARAAAVALGKALFWDQAAGSDGQACASCHFNAGADSRTKNQVDPGVRAIPPQTVFGARPPQQVGGTAPLFFPGYQLHASDFPLTKFNTPDVPSSGIASDTQAVVSSQGVQNSIFGDVTLASCPADQSFIGTLCDTRKVDTTGNGAIFNVAAGHRNVEPRNTPSTVNALFNFRNFYDSRARNEFNGVDPIGDLDPYARVLISSGTKLQKVALANASLVAGKLVPNPFGPLRLEDAALASQSVGPALSDMEMSAQNRSFAKLGKKMLALPNALRTQVVHPDDSVLGNNKVTGVKSNCASVPCSTPGINKSYAALIQAAFQSRWWGSSLMVEFSGTNDADGTVGLKISKPTKALTTNQFTQMEFNFSMFWGIAVQMYEATLRADDSPFDQAFDLGNPLTVRLPPGCDDVFTPCFWGPKQQQGWAVFQGAGRCINCHGGPELTNASVRNIRLIDGKTESMVMGNLLTKSYDVGSYNTAVRRCLTTAGSGPCDDGGIGVTIGPLNLPLAFARFGQLVQAHDPSNPADPITIVCNNQPEACNNNFPFGNEAVDGAFKTPGLRNVELTAPYMHNGSELGLADAVNFYDRGGNFPQYNIDNLDPDIGLIQCASTTVDVSGKVFCPTANLTFLELGLSDANKAALVAFMTALTDERVRLQRAPFDHPQLFVPDLPADIDPLDGQTNRCAQCRSGELPAVGRGGQDAYGNAAHPLRTFAQNLAP